MGTQINYTTAIYSVLCLKTALGEKLSLRTPGTLDDAWKHFKNTVYETSKEKLGTVGRKHGIGLMNTP